MSSEVATGRRIKIRDGFIYLFRPGSRARYSRLWRRCGASLGSPGSDLSRAASAASPSDLARWYYARAKTTR